MTMTAMEEIRNPRELDLIIRAVSLHWQFLKAHPDHEAFENETATAEKVLGKLMKVGTPVPAMPATGAP